MNLILVITLLGLFGPTKQSVERKCGGDLGTPKTGRFDLVGNRAKLYVNNQYRCSLSLREIKAAYGPGQAKFTSSLMHNHFTIKVEPPPPSDAKTTR